MRTATFDATRIRQRAKAAVENGDSTLRRWWSQKYNLPSNHALYQKRTIGSLVQEMLEDLFVRRDELKADLREATGIERLRLVETLMSIEKILADPKAVVDDGPVITGDDLVDQWEREIAEGRTPDFTRDLPKGSRLGKSALEAAKPVSVASILRRSSFAPTSSFTTPPQGDKD